MGQIAVDRGTAAAVVEIEIVAVVEIAECVAALEGDWPPE